MPTDPPRGRRLSLTKKQLQQESGEALLSLLTEVVSDGKISEDEVRRLRDWIKAAPPSELPAVGFLQEAIDEVIADGVISDADRLDIHLAIERVLPVTERAISKEVREGASEAEAPPKITRDDLRQLALDSEKPEPAVRSRSWREDSVTKPQRDFIRSLGGSVTPEMSKGKASDLIEELLGNKPISPRQQMVMRFWGRERQAGEGPREISEWLDEFHAEDPDRKKAWALFKDESEDDGLQGDPMRVRVGIGPQYLERVKRGGETAIPRFRRDGRVASSHPDLESSGSLPFAFIVVLALGCVIAYLILR